MAAAKRKAIGKKVRFEVFKRDGFTCQYCGATPPKVILQVDHIVPVVEGGGNDEPNLITSCQPCNIGKGPVPLSSAPASLKDRAAEAKEKEEQILGYQSLLRAERDRIRGECWEVAEILMDRCSEETITKADFASIRKFVTEMGVVPVIDAAEIAASRNMHRWNHVFRYFCGICWSKIKEAS